jgi:hypothetical protein
MAITPLYRSDREAVLTAKQYGHVKCVIGTVRIRLDCKKRIEVLQDSF